MMDFKFASMRFVTEISLVSNLSNPTHSTLMEKMKKVLPSIIKQNVHAALCAKLVFHVILPFLKYHSIPNFLFSSSGIELRFIPKISIYSKHP